MMDIDIMETFEESNIYYKYDISDLKNLINNYMHESYYNIIISGDLNNWQNLNYINELFHVYTQIIKSDTDIDSNSDIKLIFIPICNYSILKIAKLLNYENQFEYILTKQFINNTYIYELNTIKIPNKWIMMIYDFSKLQFHLTYNYNKSIIQININDKQTDIISLYVKIKQIIFDDNIKINTLQNIDVIKLCHILNNNNNKKISFESLYKYKRDNDYGIYGVNNLFSILHYKCNLISYKSSYHIIKLGYMYYSPLYILINNYSIYCNMIKSDSNNNNNNDELENINIEEYTVWLEILNICSDFN